MAEVPNISDTLVFHTGALGDSVLLWPVLRALAPLSFIASGEKARLAARCIPDIEAVDGDAAAWATLFGPDGWRNAPAIAPRLAAARKILCFFSNGKDSWAGNIHKLAPEARCYFAGASGATPHPTLHLLDERLLELREQGLAIEPVFASAKPASKNAPIVLHPGSGGLAKCWLPDRWSQLGRQLQKAGRVVQLILGEAERERLSPGQITIWKNEFDAIEPASLFELAEILSRARCVVANDSGPGHLAAELGVQVISLFGPTDPHRWKPRGPQVQVLAPPEPGPMNWLDVARVFQNVLQFPQPS